MIKVTLKGKPLSTQHLYFHKGHSVYMSAEGKQCKQTYQWEMKSQYKYHPIKESLSVVMEIYFDSKHKHDVDNYNKLILDAGIGILWEDDNQIWELTIRKFFDKKNPRIELTVQ